eukprot:scaffold75163_cov17-Prasinocladus_malaysianus.AAC.1
MHVRDLSWGVNQRGPSCQVGRQLRHERPAAVVRAALQLVHPSGSQHKLTCRAALRPRRAICDALCRFAALVTLLLLRWWQVMATKKHSKTNLRSSSYCSLPINMP